MALNPIWIWCLCWFILEPILLTGATSPSPTCSLFAKYRSDDITGQNDGGYQLITKDVAKSLRLNHVCEQDAYSMNHSGLRNIQFLLVGGALIRTEVGSVQIGARFQLKLTGAVTNPAANKILSESVLSY